MRSNTTISLDNLLPQVLFTHLYHCEAGWSMGKRSHPECHEMFFVLEGKGSVTVGETEYPAKGGDVFLIKPEQIHCAAADASDPYVYYSLHYSFFERENFTDTSQLEEMPLLSTFFTRLYRSLSKVSLPELSQVREIIEKMEAEKANKTVGYQTMRRVYLLQLLIIVVRAAFKKPAAKIAAESLALQNRSLLIVNQIKKYLEENLVQQITLEDIASAVRLSSHYCCSLFKEVTGYTIFQYLDRLRVERAKMLLRHSHLNVTETAEELGYQNIYYFSRVFKKVTGISPTQFIALIHNKND